jgi:hypothetical protein
MISVIDRLHFKIGVVMNKIIIIFVVGMFLSGCVTQLAPLQRRAIEAKELEGSFDEAYKSTLQVLQDYGYAIMHSDYKAGVIRGETGWKSRGIFMPRQQEVSVIIEEWDKNKVKERITFILKEGSRNQIARIIEDPEVLQKIYDDIQKEMFVRKNLSK